MEKPPFQFGLKAAFAVLTEAAVLIAIAIIAMQPSTLSSPISIAALLWLWLLCLVVVWLCSFVLAMTLYHGIRLFDCVLKKCRRQPPR